MKSPNIIMLLIDDLGWRDLSCYGSSFYQTPNLDRLAEQGVRFTDAYASCPVCSPTRASIMSGKSPARVGVTQFIGGHAVGKLCDVPYYHGLPSSERSIATALRDGGYQTWHVGKWHLGQGLMSPTRHGFDVNIAGCGWGMPQHGYFSPYQMPNLDDGPDGEYLTERLTDEAIQLIQKRKSDKPFYMNFCHYAVHTPIQAPAELIVKYEKRAAELGINQEDALEEGEHFPCQHKRNQRVVRRNIQSDAAYAAMIENLDTNIGRLLDTLDDQGLSDDTLIVFTSDNGGLSTAEGSPTCNLPLAEGKGWMYEGGNRVCQIVRWPGQVASGQTVSSPVTSMDIYPTFLEAAGLPLNPEQHVDGQSFMPILRGKAGPKDRDLFWHYPHYSNQGDTPSCAIRSGDWKLIEHFEDGGLKLFNLANDLGETNDVATNHPERVSELHARLVAWRAEAEALIPHPNPNWVPIPDDGSVDGPEV